MVQTVNLALRQLATLSLPVVGMIFGASVVGELASQVREGDPKTLGRLALEAGVAASERASMFTIAASEEAEVDPNYGFAEWSDIFRADAWAVSPAPGQVVPGDVAHHILAAHIAASVRAKADAVLTSVRDTRPFVPTQIPNGRMRDNRATLTQLSLSLPVDDAANVIPQLRTGLASDTGLIESASNSRARMTDGAFSSSDAPRIDSAGFGGFGSSLSSGFAGSSSVVGAAGDALGGAGGALKGLRK
jgi:hypothetical protein